LAESLLLVVCGTAIGLVFAFSAVRVLSQWTETGFSLAPDHTVLVYTLALSGAVTLVFGLAPAFRATRVPVAGALRVSSAAAFARRSQFASGNITTVLQVALCLTLLVATGLLVRTLQNLRHVNVGFPTRGLIVFGINPQLDQHGKGQAISFYRSLITKLRTIPGVESATLMGLRIGSGWSNVTDVIVDGAPPRDVPDKLFRWNQVGPDFFRTLRIHLITGRDFNDGDSQATPLVAVVDQRFVSQFFENGNPLGHTISYTRQKRFTIVGVAENAKYTGIQEDSMPTAWFPYTQAIDLGTMQVELRTSGDPMTLLSTVRRVVAEFAPEVALLQPRTQRAELDRTISDQILLARLSISFAVLAILLVATGLYGVISYNVTRRTNEIGLRLALGAEPGQILRMVLRRGLLLCLVGMSAGLPLVLASSQALRSLLYGIAPGDPVSIAGAIVGIIGIGLFAAYLPARRAATLDPTVALHYE
jgi:predicted permease